jgi:hypothetical protein
LFGNLATGNYLEEIFFRCTLLDHTSSNGTSLKTVSCSGAVSITGQTDAQIRVPYLPEWTGESRVQVNSPVSRTHSRREAISPGFEVILNFLSWILLSFSHFQENFCKNVFNAQKFFKLSLKWGFEKNKFNERKQYHKRLVSAKLTSFS